MFTNMEKWVEIRRRVLVDALASAGCSDAEILGHCRSECDHVRGCWIVDALLARG